MKWLRLYVGMAILISMHGNCEEVRWQSAPSWMNDCKTDMASCVLYIVNPFSLNESELGLYHWAGLGSYTLQDPARMRFPSVGSISIPQRESGTIPSGGVPLRFGITGFFAVDSDSVAPRHAFRKVSGCWPVESFAWNDDSADRSYNVVVSAAGEVFDTTGPTRIGHFYIFGSSLIQLRMKDAIEFEFELADERFFYLNTLRGSQLFDVLTGNNYVVNAKYRDFSQDECQEIQSEDPVWSEWSDRSIKSIEYPTFPDNLKSPERWKNMHGTTIYEK